jgi:hypothetical protein
MRSKSRNFQEQLNIWDFIVPESNVYEKASKSDIDLPPIRDFCDATNTRCPVSKISPKL